MLVYQSKYIPHFSHVASPLFSQLKKDARFNWSRECEEAYREPLNKLATAPVLAYPDFSKPFYIDCDASGKALGAALYQIHNNVERPIAYASRMLTDHEKSYSTPEREALAVMWSTTKAFHDIIYGYDCTIYTDHEPLVTRSKIKSVSNKLNKLLSDIQHLNYKLKY
jgi:hypothetical protein